MSCIIQFSHISFHFIFPLEYFPPYLWEEAGGGDADFDR